MKNNCYKSYYWDKQKCNNITFPEFDHCHGYVREYFYSQAAYMLTYSRIKEHKYLQTSQMVQEK